MYHSTMTSSLRALFLAFFINTIAADSQEGSGEETEESISSERFQRFIIIHGMLAVIAWGLLAPSAIIVSAFRNVIPGANSSEKAGSPAKWFLAHRFINTIVYLMTVAFFLVVVTALEKEGDRHFLIEYSLGVAKGHRVFGLIFVLLSTLQVFFGIFRPSLEAKAKKTDDVIHDQEDPDIQKHPSEKTLARIIWEYAHRFMGVLLIVGSVYQVLSGLYIYAEEGYDSAWYHSILWVYVFSLICPLLLFILLRKRD